MRRILFVNFCILFAMCVESRANGGSSTRDIFGDYGSSESDEESAVVSMETSRINKQHGEKPFKANAGSSRNQQSHKPHERSDYPIDIYEWVSGKIINEILDRLVDYIDDSGILDILDSSEEENDFYDDVTQGHSQPVMNVTTANPMTNKTTKNGTINVTEISSTTIATSVDHSTTVSSRQKNVTNAVKHKH